MKDKLQLRPFNDKNKPHGYWKVYHYEGKINKLGFGALKVKIKECIL